MCGIAGRFSPRGRVEDDAIVRRMCGALVHRGPDDDGFYADRWLAAGMRRLSIIDLAGGRQPLFSEDGSLMLLLNGEIYNFIELRRELEALGHVFRSGSDAETVVHLFEEKKLGCLDDLNGMFAFCLWDARSGEGYLVRDRIGIKPLYYTVVGGDLYFASELKALLEVPGVSRDVDEQALLEYLYYLCVPAPRTPFQGIYKLPSASVLRFGVGGIEPPARYWHYPADVADRPEAELREEFLALVDSAVELQLRSDVPVGVFLSGGFDSSLITALAARKMGQRVLSFSVAYPGNPVDETPFAELAASRFGCEHRTTAVGPERAASLLPRAVWHMDEPHADSAVLATLAVSDLAAQHVTVVLSGTGGDELFGGYAWHLPPSSALRALQALPRPVVKGLAAALLRAGMSEDDARAMRWVRDGARTFAWPHYQFKPGEVDDFFRGSPADARRAEDILADCYARARGHGLNRLLEVDAEFYLTDELLLLLDKMTMAASLEGRVPLLDHRLVEWAFRLPGRYKIRGRTRKWLLRRWLDDVLPRELLTRPKWGFGAPVEYWMRGDLAALTLRLLDSRPATRSHFAWGLRGGALADRLGRLSAQKRYALLVLELWCRLFLDGGDHARSLRELAA